MRCEGLARRRVAMAVDGKFTYPGIAASISSPLAGKAVESRQQRAASAAIGVVSVLEALGYIESEETVEMVTSEPATDLLMVAEVIMAALQAEAVDTHERMMIEATNAMMEVATEVKQ